MIRRLAAAILLALILGGCGSGVTSGTVIGHNHDPAWTQFIPMTVGKTIVLTPVYHPERWQLQLSECDPPHDGCKTGMVDVDPAAYASHPDGSYYRDGGS